MPYFSIDDLTAADADILEQAAAAGAFIAPMTVEPTGRGYYCVHFRTRDDLAIARLMLIGAAA